MEKLIKAIVLKIFPEMQQQLHLLHFAQVVAIPLPPGGGEVYDWDEPYYGVNIQMLDAHWQLYGPIHEAVPCPIPAASHTRGLFGFPQVGTVVGVQFAYGDPERPVITQPYGFDKHLPALKRTELLWQMTPATFIRATEEEDWIIQARNTIQLLAQKIVFSCKQFGGASSDIDMLSEDKVRVAGKNGGVDVVRELRRLAELLERHTHAGSPVPDNAGHIGEVRQRVASIEKQ